MVKTTVYLPEALKRGLGALARQQNRSEAELIRAGIEQLLADQRPSPNLPLFTGKDSTLAENADEALAGYGQ